MAPPRDPVEPNRTDLTAHRLLQALTEALERGESVKRDSVLHDAACERVRTLRQRGLRAEVVLADVKQLIRQAARSKRPTAAAADLDEILLAPVPVWCIEEYFRDARS